MSLYFSIKEMSRETGLSEDTIRYYEKIGVLKRAKRLASGRRYYDKTDLEIMQNLQLLKRTGMSLDDLKAYSNIAFSEEVSAAKEQQVKFIREHRTKHRLETEAIQDLLRSLEIKLEAGEDHT